MFSDLESLLDSSDDIDCTSAVKKDSMPRLCSLKRLARKIRLISHKFLTVMLMLVLILMLILAGKGYDLRIEGSRKRWCSVMLKKESCGECCRKRWYSVLLKKEVVEGTRLNLVFDLYGI